MKGGVIITVGGGLLAFACGLAGQYEEEDTSGSGQFPPACQSGNCIENCVCETGDRVGCETSCAPAGSGGTVAAGGTPGSGGRPMGTGGVTGSGGMPMSTGGSGGGAGTGGMGAFGGGPMGGSGGMGASTGCGNGVIDAGEECDGTDLGVANCSTATAGAQPDGTLDCTPGCAYDTSGCTVALLCGNGVADPSEDCDGFDLKGGTCSSATSGARPNGALACTTTTCSFDTSSCSSGCDATSCPNGCCNGNLCLSGDTAIACGDGGEPCSTCALCFTCSATHKCEVNPDSRWTVSCDSAEIKPQKSPGVNWDTASLYPDPYCAWEMPFGTFSPLVTSFRTDDLTPSWTEVIATDVRASDLMGPSWTVRVFDDDRDEGGTAEDICGVSLPLQESHLASGSVTFAETQRCDFVNVTVTCEP